MVLRSVFIDNYIIIYLYAEPRLPMNGHTEFF